MSTVSTGSTASDARLEANKRTVLAFYQAAINEKDHHAAAKLLGDTYIQHNPRIADGLEGFREFVETLRVDFPDLRCEVRRIFAEGDHVIAHVHGVRVPGGPVTAIVDIFRLEGGRIAEHWDVMQQVPDEARNRNGMF
ncbi:nuclear transport factor 2 family protein [Kitasatospora viridis]|uniref:Putative SnoaL-like aldol condensation-catalyzing enzyme n=1 Tax=Kitasatospora viridis TaxID=281105 RepID=A0A561TT38_9ACTN|nr:ester cyclase [Kitasatospora viridis]TWF90260.1 putative SnoaL-like aldol condensation-catalyzing enzyme [Kitasatospora viridis]